MSVKSSDERLDVKSVYTLRTHEINANLKVLYDKLVADLGYENVFVLYDATNVKLPEDCPIDKDRIYVVDDPLCLKNNSFHDKGHRSGSASMSFWHPETSFVLLGYWLTFVKKITFDYIWFVEYDVHCNGDFAKAFGKCDSIPADFMARGRDNGPEDFRVGSRYPWCWWGELQGEIAAVPQANRVGCFLPLVRCSKKMLDSMRNHFNKSTGFCEVYMTTLASKENLVAKPLPLDALGIFRYRPLVTEEELKAFKGPTDVLFHPVKIF